MKKHTVLSSFLSEGWYELRPLHTESEMFACVLQFFRILHPFLLKWMLRMRKLKIEPGPKVSEAVCKRDCHNVRLYLFFNMQKFQMQISDSVCRDLYYCNSTLKWRFQIINRGLGSAVKLSTLDLNPWQKEVVLLKRGFLKTLHCCVLCIIHS